MAEMNRIVGNNLKISRETSGLTQDQVAKFIGINRSTYSNYEQGKRETPYNVLEKLANLFGCDAYLFFEEDKFAKRELLLTAFRIDEDLDETDLKEIAYFKEVVKSYLKMDKLIHEKA